MSFLFPDWPAPPSIRAAVTLRSGGKSQGPYASFNLAAHVGDDPKAIALNRELLRQSLNLPTEPKWLKQVHGDHVICADTVHSHPPTADGSFTTSPNVVCAVLTADCLPILLTDGYTVAAVHAGWRGILAGVIEQALTVPPWRDSPIAWLGPAIGPEAFEVGEEVKTAFLAKDPALALAFRPQGERYLADIYLLACTILRRYQVKSYGGGFCTFSDPERFFSYRRDRTCGRMASLIWRVEKPFPAPIF